MDKHSQLTLNTLDEIIADKLMDTPWTPEARNAVKFITDQLMKDGFTRTHTFNNEWEATIVLTRGEHVYYLGRAKDLNGKWLTYIQHTTGQMTEEQYNKECEAAYKKSMRYEGE